MRSFSFFAAVLPFCLLAFSAISQAAQAGGIQFTQPVTSPTLKGNQTYMVMWQFDASKFTNPSSPGTLQLGVSRDGTTNVEIIKVITESINIGSGVYNWVVPPEVQTSDQYSLTLVIESMPFYSPKFTIQNGAATPPNPNPSPAPSNTPTTTPTPIPKPSQPNTSGSDHSISTAMATLLSVFVPVALALTYLKGAQV